MRRDRDSSGLLVVIVGVVMTMLALVGLLEGDPSSVIVFGPLAAAAFVADLVLRRRTKRPFAADLYLVALISTIFAMIFSFSRDWRLVTACAAIALTAGLTGYGLLRKRSPESPSGSRGSSF